MHDGGSIDPRVLPGRLPVSTNAMRAADASMLTSINGLFLYGNEVTTTTASSGGGQLDQGGNGNTRYIGDADRRRRNRC